MRKQSVRKGVWYIGGRRRKRRQKGGFSPVGAILGSLAGPALGAVAGPVVKKNIWWKKMASPSIYLDKKILLR